MKQTHTLTLGGEEIDVDFEIDADITYEREYTTGLPENCYPAYGECDITEIKVLSQIDGFRDADIIDALETQRGEAVEDELWDWYHSRGSDDGA